jgi:hypothetical protein
LRLTSPKNREIAGRKQLLIVNRQWQWVEITEGDMAVSGDRVLVEGERAVRLRERDGRVGLRWRENRDL